MDYTADMATMTCQKTSDGGYWTAQYDGSKHTIDIVRIMKRKCLADNTGTCDETDGISLYIDSH
jgi:hypothetical protein